jgi:hypothetical protein
MSDGSSLADREAVSAQLRRLHGEAAGRWVVIHDGKVTGVFDTLAQASWFASEHYAPGTALIRQGQP